MNDKTLLIFRIAGIACAVPAESVGSIVMPPSHLTHPPGSARSTPGIFHHADATYSVIDLHQRFGIDTPRQGSGRLLLREEGIRHFAFWVDEVVGLVGSERGKWAPLPTYLRSSVFSTGFLYREEIVLCTELDKLRTMHDVAPLQRHFERLQQQRKVTETKNSTAEKRHTAEKPLATPKPPQRPKPDKPEPAPRPRQTTISPQPKQRDTAPAPVARRTASAPPTQRITPTDSPNRHRTTTTTRRVGAENTVKSPTPTRQRPSVTPPPERTTAAAPLTTEGVSPPPPPSGAGNESGNGALWLVLLLLLLLSAPAAYWLWPEPVETPRRYTPPPSIETKQTLISENHDGGTGPTAPITAAVPPAKPASTPDERTPTEKAPTEATPLSIERDAKGTINFILDRHAIAEGTETAPLPLSPDKKATETQSPDSAAETATTPPTSTKVVASADTPDPATTATEQTEPVPVVQPKPGQEGTRRKAAPNTEAKPEPAKNAREATVEPEPEADWPRPVPLEPCDCFHIVVPGDTLWSIARRYTGTGLNFPELARRSGIENPDLIYPGDKVRFIIR